MLKFFLFFFSAILFVSCASQPSAPQDVRKEAPRNLVPVVDIDDALLGTWVQSDVSCSKEGQLTPLGKEISTAYRSGLSAARAVVTSDKVFWDMKEYKDVENPANFCQVSVEEKWTTKSTDQLVVADSEALVSGSGDVVCDKKYTYSKARTHKYKATDKSLAIYLNSTHDALTGVSVSEKPICKTGEVVLSFQRDSADE